MRAVHKRLPESVPEYFREIEKPIIGRRKRAYYEPEYVFNIIQDESKNLAARTVVAFQFLMLCRPSEYAALTPQDVNFETGEVIFNKAFRKVGPDEFKVMPNTKSGEESNRSVIMPSFLLELMKRHCKNLKPNQYIFRTARGHAITNFKAKGYWKWVRTQLGMDKGPTMYSLKSSGNSYYQAMGLTPEALRFTTGHATDSKMLITNYRVPVRAEEQRRHTIVEEAIQRAAGRIPGSQGENAILQH